MTNRERYVDSSGARIWTCTSGTGIPFLMFNGGPGCDDYLGRVAELIEDVCQVVRFEPRGCGRSDWDGNYAVDTLIDDAEEVRKAYGLEHCIVGGHSFGPDVALTYAMTYPRAVIGLIGMAGGRIVNDRNWHATYRRNLARIGEDLGGVIFNADPNVNVECTRSWREYIKRPTLLRDIAAVEIPATFIYGSDDIRPDWPTRQLAQLLPHGRFVEIVGAAHTIWLSHAGELSEKLHDAIDRISSFSSSLSS